MLDPAPCRVPVAEDWIMLKQLTKLYNVSLRLQRVRQPANRATSAMNCIAKSAWYAGEDGGLQQLSCQAIYPQVSCLLPLINASGHWPRFKNADSISLLASLARQSNCCAAGSS